MRNHFRYIIGIAAAASVFTACDSSPVDPVMDMERRDDIIITTPSGKTYKLPTKGSNGDDVAFGYVTPQGGILAAGGHQLVVPAGAVTSPTWFRMVVIGGDKIQVKLKAWRAGDWSPVSRFPASAPVQLKLNASGVSELDLSNLVVVYLRDETMTGAMEPVQSSVDGTSKFVTGYLTHFSMYALAREYSIGLD